MLNTTQMECNPSNFLFLTISIWFTSILTMWHMKISYFIKSQDEKIFLYLCVENANQIKTNILKKKHPTISKNICVHFIIYLPLSTVNNQIVKHKSIYELMQRHQVSFLKSSLQWSLRNITFFRLLYFAHIM